jgi:cohesin complex subunit SA-1/2
MIEQALHVLMLHVLWKTKGLTVEADPTPDEIRYKEVLQEQREVLLEKLVEYAVGTQSNTQLKGSNERYVGPLCPPSL